ncbi:hypothetical protein J6590_034803 [Homalodisca vitripennis]|nr:hypothetical protein J6590_034803 [Homalodisca vitripennis]
MAAKRCFLVRRQASCRFLRSHQPELRPYTRTNDYLKDLILQISAYPGRIADGGKWPVSRKRRILCRHRHVQCISSSGRWLAVATAVAHGDGGYLVIIRCDHRMLQGILGAPRRYACVYPSLSDHVARSLVLPPPCRSLLPAILLYFLPPYRARSENHRKWGTPHTSAFCGKSRDYKHTAVESRSDIDSDADGSDGMEPFKRSRSAGSL